MTTTTPKGPAMGHAPSRNAAETAILELRATLENQSTRLTEIASELRGLSLNSVLLAEMLVLPAGGIVHRDTSTPYASVGAWAYGQTIIIDSGGEGAAAPGSGIGMLRVPAASAIVWPMVGTGITVYGDPGDEVLLALWSKPQPPRFTAAAGGTIDGGGA